MPGLKLLRLKDVMLVIGVSKSTIYDWMNPRSKRFSGFPAPIKISAKSVRWDLNEIEIWLANRTKSGS